MHDSVRAQGALQPLHDPILIAGFTDHLGSTGAAAVQHLVEQWEAQLVAEIDPEEFFDFSVRRPLVYLEGDARVLDWPTTRIYVAKPAGAERDVVLLVGIEPSLRWRTFSEAVQSVLVALGVHEAMFVASYPGATPHTRPTPIRMVTSDHALAARFGLEASAPTYEGPIGILGVLLAQLEAAGLTVVHLSAITPFYLMVNPNPGAMSTLIETLDRGLGTRTEQALLREQAELLNREAGNLASNSEQLAAVIEALEQQSDWLQRHADGQLDQAPPAASLLADVEQFLRQQREAGGQQGGGSNAIGTH